MELKPEKISEVIRSQIKNYQNAIIQNETGTVQKSAYTCDTITNCKNCTSLILDNCILIILYLASNDLGYFFWF